MPLALSGSDKLFKESRKYYFGCIAAICFVFLVIQFFYIPYATLSIDDFWLAYHTYHYKTLLPYRDFAPYKTVLGYYIFLVPLNFSYGLLKPIFFIKYWLTLINVIFLLSTTCWLRKFFSSTAILLSVTLIVFTQIFLSYSSDIRVDLLAYWLCLISVMFVFEENYFLAGIVLGLGFLVCQKAIWYFIAMNAGLAGCWLVNERTWRLIKNILVFNFSTIIIVSAYILFWSYFSSLKIVLHSVFYEAYIISSVDWYTGIRTYFWNFIITNNPGLFLLWPFALFGLFMLPAKRHVFIAIYASVILFFVFSCKQPFAYYPLAAVPALFLLYAEFFTSLHNAQFSFLLARINKKLIICFSFFYIAGLFFLFLKFTFPDVYLMIALVPLLLCASLMENIGDDIRNAFIGVMFCLFFVIGNLFSLIQFVNFLGSSNGHYQKSMIYLMDNLLNKGDSYVAGVPLLLDVEQPVPGLVHIVAPAVDYLFHPSNKLYPVVTLSSLYLVPVTTQQIIESIKNAPIKLYVDNDRFHSLPPEIHQYLATQYQHFWGSIFLYAPQVAAGNQNLKIKFDGNYKVHTKKNSVISIDNQKIKPDEMIHLVSRSYLSNASEAYRLEFISEQVKSNLLEPKYKDNNWQRMLN